MARSTACLASKTSMEFRRDEDMVVVQRGVTEAKVAAGEVKRQAAEFGCSLSLSTPQAV